MATNGTLPSSTAASRCVDGVPGAWFELAAATLLRSALIAPGLYFAGVPKDRILKGALLASGMISGYILIYLLASAKK